MEYFADYFQYPALFIRTLLNKIMQVRMQNLLKRLTHCCLTASRCHGRV